jgi:hypothetical protein
MLPIVVSTDEAHGGGARNVELLCLNPRSEPFPKQHLRLMVDQRYDAIVLSQESLFTQFRLGFHFDLLDCPLIHPRPFRVKQVHFVAALGGPSA